MELKTRWTQLDRMAEGGDTAAWFWFCDRYRGYVAALLRRRLTAALADEAADDFWTYLFEHDLIARADRSRGFRKFLSGIVRNYALAWSRKRRKLLDLPLPSQGEGDDAEQLDPEAPGMVDPAELVAEEEEQLFSAHVVRLAVAELQREKPAAAKALRWFYGIPGLGEPDEKVDQLKASEIAERLDTNANNVHVMLHRARARMRGLVDQELEQTVATAVQLEHESQRVRDHSGILYARPGDAGLLAD